MNEHTADRRPRLRRRQTLRMRFIDWVMRRHGPARREIRLDRRRIYILPTRHGYLFAVLLVVMLIGAANYSNSMAFILAFLLMGLGANAMWHTHRNLLNLKITVGHAPAVFAGQDAQIPLTLTEGNGRARHAIALQWETHEIAFTDVPARGNSTTILKVPAPRRGLLRPGRIRIYTRYPLGLFQAWSWIEFDTTVIVYPNPLTTRHPLPTAVATQGLEGDRARGSEDYSGLRQYRPGDPPRHVAWKSVARTDTLVTKEFSGEGRREIRLHWDAVPEREIEYRLSVLCGWVLEAEASGLRYGLSIPGIELSPGHGDAHRQQCLRALAMFGRAET